MLGQHHHRAEPVADGGGDRLAQRPQARADDAARATSASRRPQQILRARLTYQGTTLRFSTEESDAWWWLMNSADANAARLLLAVLDDPAWKDDMPRMVRGSLGRQRGGAWLTTDGQPVGRRSRWTSSRPASRATPVAGRTRPRTAAPAAALAQAWSPTGAGSRTASRRSVRAGRTAREQRLDAARRTGARHGSPGSRCRASAAIPLKAPFAAGYRVTRSGDADRAEGQGRAGRARRRRCA